MLNQIKILYLYNCCEVEAVVSVFMSHTFMFLFMVLSEEQSMEKGWG